MLSTEAIWKLWAFPHCQSRFEPEGGLRSEICCNNGKKTLCHPERSILVRCANENRVEGPVLFCWR
jgi:hypothetical protein